MDAARGGQLGGVVAAGAGRQGLVVGDAPGLAEQLDGDDLRVGVRRPRAAGAQGAEGHQFVVDEADCHQRRILRGHGGSPGRSVGW